MEEKNAPWLKFYGNIPAHIDYPDLTMYEYIEKTANENPDNNVFEFYGKYTSYKTFLEKIDAIARSLTAIGIRKGDRVTIAMPNTPQAICTLYALNKIGAIANTVHPLSAPTEIAFYLNFSHSKAILILDRFYYKVCEIRDQLENDTTVIVARIQDELPPIKKLLFPIVQKNKNPVPKDGLHIEWNDFLKNGRSTELPKNIKMTADECAAILYSGGTTGTTKGIALSSRNFNALGLQTAAASGYDSIKGMTMLSVMPIFHGFGLGIGIHTAIMGGCMCHVVPQFSVKEYAAILTKKKPNFIPGVPTLFEALLRAPKLENADLSFLRGVFSGGDSLSIELKTKVDKFLKEHNAPVQIREGYGTTECVTASCLTPKDDYRVGSIGIPFPDTYYTIVRPGTNEVLSANEEGEICLRGPSVMIGYVDNPEETAQTLRTHDDGYKWLHTGDLGKMDEDGFVYFKQRIKRMIITSGYNVYPSQLENIIDGHEKVLISCVIGVKDPYKMQKVKAFVVPAPGVTPSDELKKEILDYCKKHIAKYAMPYDIEFREELPKTLVGKVAYRVLEEEEAAREAAEKEKAQA